MYASISKRSLDKASMTKIGRMIECLFVYKSNMDFVGSFVRFVCTYTWHVRCLGLVCNGVIVPFHYICKKCSCALCITMDARNLHGSRDFCDSTRRYTGTVFPSKDKKLFVMYIIKE